MKNYYSFYKTYNYFKKKIKQKLNSMIARCENPKGHAYRYYGEKGIRVCPSWKNNPENFIGWCLENDYLPGKEIHRLNPHKNYDPENCILCTKKEHIYYHQLLIKSRKEFKESIRIHDEIEKLYEIYFNKR